jgi:hypothetical protein
MGVSGGRTNQGNIEGENIRTTVQSEKKAPHMGPFFCPLPARFIDVETCHTATAKLNSLFIASSLFLGFKFFGRMPSVWHLRYGFGFAGVPCNAFCIASISAPKVRQSPLFNASKARR